MSDAQKTAARIRASFISPFEKVSFEVKITVFNL